MSMRVYFRPGPMRRPVPVDIDPTATVSHLRQRVGAEALYLTPPKGLRSALAGMDLIQPSRDPLDDDACVGALVPPHATLLAAPKPLPRSSRLPAPKADETLRALDGGHGAPSGAWTLKLQPTPLVTTTRRAPAATPPPYAEVQLAAAAAVADAPAERRGAPAPDEVCRAGPPSLVPILGEDWEDLSVADELDDAGPPSDCGAWSLAGHIVQGALQAEAGANLASPVSVAGGIVQQQLVDMADTTPDHEAAANAICPSACKASESLVFAWGDNALGQCLAGEGWQRVPTPRPVALDCPCVSLCCGSSRSILVTKHGTLWGGGLNAGRTLTEASAGGSLHDPTCLDLPELSEVSLTAIAAGHEHILAVTRDGALLTWAASNADGQAGVGSELVKAVPVMPQAPSWPLRGLNDKQRVASVACGDAHSLVLTEGGELFAFGNNSCGQLGLGEGVQQASSPAAVGSRIRGVPLRAVAAGCRHSLALTVSGSVFAWGSNEEGCLGVGGLSCPKSMLFLPAFIPGLPGPGRHISAGGKHSAIIACKGRLFLAGSNSCGQLGRPRAGLPCSYDFVELPAELQLCTRSASLGREHSVLLTYDGELHAFGRNTENQCGIPNTSALGAQGCMVETPTRVKLPTPFGRECPLIVWAVAAGHDHNLVLCSPGPDTHERLPTHLLHEPFKLRRPSSGLDARVKRPLQSRRATYGARGVSDTCSDTAADVFGTFEVPDGLPAGCFGLTGTSAACSSRAAAIPAVAVPLRAKEGWDGREAVELEEGQGVASARTASPPFVLLRPVVQPGTAPCPFVALSVPRLTSLLTVTPTASHDEHLQALCLALARPSVLNASFCYPGLRTARLDAAGLCRTLAVVCARDEAAGPRLLDAAAEGLALLSDGPVEDLVQRDQLRALAIYLCIPARRPPNLPPPPPPAGGGARAPRSLLAGIAHLVMRMPAAGRTALRDLLADECGDVRVLRDFIVPHVRTLADDAIRNTGQQPWLAGALWEVVNQLQLQRPLWEAVLLLQILASASEEAARLLRPVDTNAGVAGNLSGAASLGNGSSLEEAREAGRAGAPTGEGPNESASSGSLATPATGQARAASLLDASAFQLFSLAEGFIPPEVEFWLFQEHAQFRQITPGEVVDEPWWSDAASMLPRRFCSFMAHANLVPVAFKQRVLQVENVLRQRLSQEQVLWPQAEMVLSGGRADPSAFYFMLSVSRNDLLRATFAQMYSASPVDLRRPLRVEFVGEEAVDEGGVMREFFRVLSTELFAPEAGLFFEAEGSRRLWFSPTLGPGRQLEDYWMVGVIVALAVYNNHPGLDVPLPSVLFKKLKGEQTTHEDLAQLFPVHARSLEAILAWTPSQPTDTEAGRQAADKEFTDTFCLSFCLAPPSPGSSQPAASPPPEQPLCQDGEERPVLFRDRGCFAARARQFLLHTSVQPQFESFARGFRHVCNSPLFDVLRPEELEAIVAGQTDLDFSSLRQGAQYEGFSPNEPYIESFWQVLEGFAMPRKRRFLAFCTGSDVAPAQGLQDLRLLVQRHGEEPTSRLPVAHTCFNLLLLPRYSSTEKLRAMLVTAVEWTEGFGLQ